jgi:cytidyltransferase-like protein
VNSIVVTSGYFNPLGEQHLHYLNWAKYSVEYGHPHHIVIVNNDKQVELKGSCPFMKEMERYWIVENLKTVDEVRLSIDYDSSVCKTLRAIRRDYPDSKIALCNGGDVSECREAAVCKELGILVKYNVGGATKVSSSSQKLYRAYQWYKTNNK